MQDQLDDDAKITSEPLALDTWLDDAKDHDVSEVLPRSDEKARLSSDQTKGPKQHLGLSVAPGTYKVKA